MGLPMDWELKEGVRCLMLFAVSEHHGKEPKELFTGLYETVYLRWALLSLPCSSRPILPILVLCTQNVRMSDHTMLH